MLDITPDARLVDVTHAIRHFALRDGAFLLARSVPYFPVGVHVGVVDPGVGTDATSHRAEGGEGRLPGWAGQRPARARGPGPGRDRRGARPREPGAVAAERVAHVPRARHLLAGGSAPGRRRALRERRPGAWGGRGHQARAADRHAARRRFGQLDPAHRRVRQLPPRRRDVGPRDCLWRDGARSPIRPCAFLRGVPDAATRIRVPWVTTFGEVPIGSPLLFEDADYAGPALAINLRLCRRRPRPGARYSDTTRACLSRWPTARCSRSTPSPSAMDAPPNQPVGTSRSRWTR